MSRSYRQPVGAQPSVPVAQTPLPGRMVAPICTTGTPAVFPVMPNAYGLISHPPQPYIAQPVVYPQPVSNIQNKVPFVAAVPPNVPRMFVPVTHVPPGMSPVADPTKLLEEQKRLEKERNFQMQQERLKQFTVAGKKSGINADNLIDSMFGKLQPKKIPAPSQPLYSTKINERNVEKRNVQNIPFDVQKLKNSEPPDIKPNISTNFFTSIHSSIPDKKELDSMMLECSNLNAPSKAVKFQKQSVKEITPSSSHGTTFTSSEKARDWRNVQGLDQVFTIPKPRFPSWCHRDKVPEMFKKVQAVATNNDMHAPDTNLLFPILMSSGLSREMLGQIWESVNESASGQLTVEEMFAALALIALVQAGLPVKSMDILHQVPTCPVPQLSCFSSATPLLDGNKSTPLTAEASPAVETSHSEHPVHQVVRPTAISLTSHPPSDMKEVTNVTENIASWTPFTGSSNMADDDFDDFKSATPTAINFSLATPASQAPPIADDDFDDFKQAPCINNANESFPTSETSKKTQESAPIQEDLMSPEEDKYSVFRSLQQNQDSSHWGDFTFSSIPNDSTSAVVSSRKETDYKENVAAPYPSLLITESTDGPGLFQNACISENNKNIQEEDEFGDFIHAGAPAHEANTSSDFADFSNFKSAESDQFSSVPIDEEFGEFTSSVSVSLKPEMGQDFLFRHLKDNISLAESQSVSSLELGTFDGGGNHSGESKSSLSRQGSIPSLDLKSVGLDGTDTEDCLGEIHLSSFVPRNSNSKSPSPVSNNKAPDENDTISTSIGLVFQTPGLSLTDKYSVIRQEKTKDEDQHVSCWIQCLQSAVDILQSTKKIFNHMSCSSVCNEVLTSEEGENYVKNVIEVYKVICRIGVSSKAVSKQTDAILDLLNEADQVWNTVAGFFAGSTLMPEESSLNFSSGVLRSEPENNSKACGLCLLNIELRSKSFRLEECPKLSYGGRNYHSTCANFWVNCVDPLLPALVLPQLL